MNKSETRSILDFLCQQFDGVELDAKHLLVHWVMPKLKDFKIRGIIMSYPLKDEDDDGVISLLTRWPIDL
jgi:hypothetical protein